MPERVAYKFLRAGGSGRFSGFAWPLPRDGRPGDWVEASGPLAPCANGVHACLPAQTPLWIDEDLWELELDGEIVELADVVLARRGRLLARVDAWTPETARAFASACAERARDHAAGGSESAAGYAADAAAYAATGDNAQHAAVAAFVAAHAADAAAPGSYEAERAWQAAWLAERLGLAGAAI